MIANQAKNGLTKIFSYTVSSDFDIEFWLYVAFKTFFWSALVECSWCCQRFSFPFSGLVLHNNILEFFIYSVLEWVQFLRYCTLELISFSCMMRPCHLPSITSHTIYPYYTFFLQCMGSVPDLYAFGCRNTEAAANCPL